MDLLFARNKEGIYSVGYPVDCLPVVMRKHFYIINEGNKNLSVLLF